jgi:hypothetical protein
MYNKAPTRHRYPGLHDFGAGSGSFYFKGPKGKEGRLVDYGIEGITEAFTNDTTAGTVEVGTASDADAYGDGLDLGTAAIADGTKSLLTTYRPGKDSGHATLLVDPTLPKDTAVKVTMTAPTGGTPAGIAGVFVDVIWDD